MTTSGNAITYHNTFCRSVQKFCISIVFSFSYAKFWSDQQRVSWYVTVFSVVVNSYLLDLAQVA